MGLLGPSQIRALAESLDLLPSKRLGQNFVIDPNTVERIARVSGIGPQDVVLEVGPGLGSLTLALLATGARVEAVEVDRRLAEQLAVTVGQYAPEAVGRLRVIHADALRIGADEVTPTAMVANLPYNVGVPILLTALERLPTMVRGLVMVQWEVAERLTAAAGGRSYGVPTVKSGWWADTRLAGKVGTEVFWPAPNVKSGLVAFQRHSTPPEALRREAFAAIDAAFAQRRKTLRAALAGWAGSAAAAQEYLRRAGIDPGARGETLHPTDYAELASAKLGPVSS